MEITVEIHAEGEGFWADVRELPGCLASARTLEDLRDALGEAVGIYLWDEPAVLSRTDLRPGRSALTVFRRV